MNNHTSTTFPPNGSFTSGFFSKTQIPKTIAYCLLFLVSIVGNSLIVWIIYKDKRLRNTTNFLVANMAVSDLLSIIFFAPSTVMETYFGRWLITDDFGLALCKLVYFIPNASAGVSLYSCVFIAIDRYYAVAHPLLRREISIRTQLKYIIPGIWIFSGLVASPFLYNFVLHKTSHGMTKCYPRDWLFHKIHIYIYLALTTGIPLPVIAVLYVLIVFKLRHHKSPGNQTDLARRRREQQNMKVLKMSVAIISLMYVSWLFFDIVVILALESKFGNNLTYWQIINLFFAAEFLANLSYTYNFFIYVIFNDIYRENAKAILTKLCYCCKNNRNVQVGSVGQELAITMEELHVSVSTSMN